MSASDAAPLPRLGEVFFDVRGSSRSMRLSWYSDTGVAVFSIWQGGTCTGTFRLPMDDLPRMVDALQRGPRGTALPGAGADARDGSGERPRRGLAAAPTDPAMTAVGNFPDYAAGQSQAPVTGEFRGPGPGPGPGDAPAGFQNAPSAEFGGRGAGRRPDLRSAPEPRTGSIQAVPYGDAPYGGDPLGTGPIGGPAGPSGPSGPSGGYRQEPYRDRGPALPEPSFQPAYPDDPAPPAYRDSGPPAYRDSGPQPYRDDPLGPGGAGSSYREDLSPAYRDSEPPYREDPLGMGGPGGPAGPSGPSGGYRQEPYRDRGPALPEPSFQPAYPDDPAPPAYRDSGPPAYRDSGPQPYRDDPLGPGGAGSSYREDLSPAYRDSEPPYREDPLGMGGPGGPAGPGPGPGYRQDLTPYRDDQYEPAYRDGPNDPRDRGYADDPFQSVYPEDARDRGYPDDPRSGSHPYGPPPDRDSREQRAPRGRS